jgi:hypothetical protein
MAIRQSILALYGAISEGLEQLDDPSRIGENVAVEKIRAAVRVLVSNVGITGSAGERGWYGELLRYFDDHRTSTEVRVTSPPLDEVHDDLDNLRDDEQPLAPTWTARAIEAALVLDTMTQEGVGPGVGLDPFLNKVLTVAPTPREGTNPGLILGETEADALANVLYGTTIYTRIHLGELLLAGGVSSAVATNGLYSRLRKVKGEYCCVVSSETSWSDIAYLDLFNVVNPVNWDDFYEEFFCKMAYQGDNAAGWARVREEVSGNCDRYRLRTALKFWSDGDAAGFFINYDLDEDPVPVGSLPTDPLVLVDNGYIWATPQPGGGVLVRTSKQLLISGMSATALTNMAATLGWATNASDMFHEAAQGAPGAQAFNPSTLGVEPTPDTSTTWPVKVPKVPADLRGEMIRDSADVTNYGLDLSNDLSTKFAYRWRDGLDAPEVYELIDELGDDVKKFSRRAFEKSTENFRPAQPSA